MSSRQRQRILASPPLGETGGGVGQVASMLWDVFRAAWPGSARLHTLDVRGTAPGRLARKVRFGAGLAASQGAGRAECVFFTHIGLLRAERWVPRAVRAPYGVFLHGVEGWQTLPAADLELLRHAAIRLTNSQFTASRVRQANGGIGDLITCPLALPDVPEISARRTTARQALIVGRLSAGERYKGHDQLIEIWPDVLARVPGAELVIAGDGDDRARLEARANRSAAASHIRFTGFVDRAALDRLYADASVFVLPSRGEGFGLVYLEAMAHARACIGSIHDAAREIIVHGETGLLVDPDDPRSVIDALVRLLTDDVYRDACGAAGRQRLMARFSRDRFAQQVRTELDRVFDSPAARTATRQATT